MDENQITLFTSYTWYKIKCAPTFILYVMKYQLWNRLFMKGKDNDWFHAHAYDPIPNKKGRNNPLF